MSGIDHPVTTQRDEDAAAWCLRLADIPLNAREQVSLDEWIAADPANAGALQEAIAIWQGIDATAAMPEMLGYRVEAVDRLRRSNACRWSPESSRIGRRAFVTRWPVLGTLAACLALIIVAMSLFYDPAQTYRTGIGERRVVMLADGTRLTLDGSSQVDVQFERDRRRLELVSGRAKFDVAHDPLRPLSVLARNRLTVATGTSFSVELLPSQMRVVLYEGRVEVMARSRDGADKMLLDHGRDSGAELLPGRELIASTDDLSVRVDPTDVPRSQSWENGFLTFAGEPLALAVERVNRGATTRLVVEDPRIASYRVSGVFAIGDVDAFVEGVSAIYPIDVVRGDATLTLKPRENRRADPTPGV